MAMMTLGKGTVVIIPKKKKQSTRISADTDIICMHNAMP